MESTELENLELKDTSTISFAESKIVESALNSPLKIPKDAIQL